MLYRSNNNIKMKYLLILFGLIIFICRYYCFEDEKLFVPHIVQQINSLKNNPWKADTYGHTLLPMSHMRNRFGAVLNELHPPNSAAAVQTSIPLSANGGEDIKLPEYFNWATTNRTDCPIGKIRDQSSCGSCWAVSTASTFSDRVCIKSNGKLRTPLSGNFIASCDKSNNGCNGGDMSKVNEFVRNVGVITGGEYESDEGCQPYSIRPCGHPYAFPCIKAITPKCKGNKCSNEWYGPTETTAFRAKSWYKVNETGAEIMREIYNNGPVTAAFLVFSDMAFYKKGIYVVTPDAIFLESGHAIKVVGWGIENNVTYWIAQNSWGAEWGENGFFRIKRVDGDENVDPTRFQRTISALIPDL